MPPYVYPDADTWAGEDDAAWNAGDLLRLRDAAAEAWNQRLIYSGHAWPPRALDPPSGFRRLCSAFGDPFGPIPVFSHLPVERVALHLRLAAVENESVRIIATAGLPNGAVNLPPVDPGDWGGLDNGALLAVTGAPQTVSLTNIPVPARGQEGVILIFVWIASDIASAADQSGTFSGALTRRHGGTSVPGLTTGAPPSNPPERVLRIQRSIQGQADEGEIYQLMHWDVADKIAYLWPDAGINNADDAWSIYKLGVIELLGCAAEAQATDYPGPAREALFNAEPILELSGLVDSINVVVASRVPQLGLLQSFRDVDANGAAFESEWLARYAQGTFVNLDTGWRELDARVAGAPISDDNGWQTFVGLYLAKAWNAEDQDKPILRLRLVATDPSSGAPILTGPTREIEPDAIGWQDHMRPSNSGAMAYNAWGCTRLVSWQYRGMPAALPGQSRSRGIRAIQWLAGPILPSASLTYPCRITLEAQLSVAYPTELTLCATCFVARNLDAI